MFIMTVNMCSTLEDWSVCTSDVLVTMTSDAKKVILGADYVWCLNFCDISIYIFPSCSCFWDNHFVNTSPLYSLSNPICCTFTHHTQGSTFFTGWPQTLNIFFPAVLGEKRCFSRFFFLESIRFSSLQGKKPYIFQPFILRLWCLIKIGANINSLHNPYYVEQLEFIYILTVERKISKIKLCLVE